jgi:hypothetical protein
MLPLRFLLRGEALFEYILGVVCFTCLFEFIRCYAMLLLSKFLF